MKQSTKFIETTHVRVSERRARENDCIQSTTNLHYISDISTKSTLLRKPYNLRVSPPFADPLKRVVSVAVVKIGGIVLTEISDDMENMYDLGMSRVNKNWPASKTSLEEVVGSAAHGNYRRQEIARFNKEVLSFSQPLEDDKIKFIEEFMDDDSDDISLSEQLLDNEKGLSLIRLETELSSRSSKGHSRYQNPHPTSGLKPKFKIESYDNLSCKEELLERLDIEEITSYSQLVNFFSNTDRNEQMASQPLLQMYQSKNPTALNKNMKTSRLSSAKKYSILNPTESQYNGLVTRHIRSCCEIPKLVIGHHKNSFNKIGKSSRATLDCFQTV